ncbi:MAG: 2-oxoacid:acceptor oxidoreductase family protein [Chloroflexi bacterium]|nr:2-oxoacid:acceptor oxidoreductase family protein [Chloroflexota bacterium]
MPTAVGRRLTQIRWHGRGGQGAVTAGNLLVEVALDEGRYFQSTPDYGAERTGAPVAAYTLVSDDPIYTHTPITDPDVVVVLDSTLVGKVDFLAGLREEGLLVINSKLSPKELRQQLGVSTGRVCTVDASRIALDTIGRNIPNVSIIGALLKVEEVVSPKAARLAIERRLKERFDERVVKANMQAFESGYNQAQVD